MSYTKGPWIIIGNNICYDSDYGGPFKSIAENVKDHNINLISAAPEMLEALELILEDTLKSSGTTLGNFELNKKIRYAIKKARGELK